MCHRAHLVCVVAKQQLGVEVDEQSAMIGLDSFMERFVATGLDGSYEFR
jgi:hypothetical protein